MKTILVSLAITALGAGIAVAEKPKSPSKTAPKKQNFGESFELKSRTTSKPRDTETVVVRSVTEAQAGRVIKDRLGEVENCWLKLPAGKRTTSAAFLKVTIEAGGNVSSARIEGELPAGVGKCITTAAQRWTFPVADARSEIEHGITLTVR
jgi:hypothetical protein